MAQTLRTDTASLSTSALIKMKKLSPMVVLRRLPPSFASRLSMTEHEEGKKDIDEIEKRCDAKVLVILVENHILIDYTTLSDFIQQDADFEHIALPTIKTIAAHDFDDSLPVRSQQIEGYIKLAKLIEKYYFEYDGFVIIEQVSKLAYASSYLSFMLENLSKPVVFTSSTTKLDHAFNDAKSNLISSVIIAGRTDINEVCVCFDRRVYRGNRVIRHDQSSHSAFSSPNHTALAEFGTALVINKSLLLPTAKKGFRAFTKIFTDIIVLYITPCTNFLLFKYLLCNQKKKGIVLSFYGAGNAPQSKQLRDIFKECINDHQCQIVITTQCLKGPVNMSVYATGSFFSGIGLINGKDMSVEACVAKLSYLMGKGLNGLELRNRFNQCLVGEMTNDWQIKGRIVNYKRIKGDHHGVDKVIHQTVSKEVTNSDQ